MRFCSKLLTALVVAGGTSLASATPLENYNLILFNDFSPSGGSGHVHGTAFIGGNLNGQNPEFGADLPSSLGTNSVEVAGDLNANQLKVQAGYLAYGGADNLGTVNCNGSSFGGNSACVTAASGLDTKRDNLYSELSGESAYYAGLAATGNVDLGSKSLTYIGGATDLAVFNLDGGDLFAQNSNWNLDFGAADKVVINVSGGTLANAGGVNLNGGFNHTNQADILWNFYGVEGIDFGSTQWFGSVLAVDAVINAANDLNGTLVADSYVGNGEIHIANWTPPSMSVPEPNPSLLLMTGLGALLIGRLKRSRRA